jgi:hypothetical protein
MKKRQLAADVRDPIGTLVFSILGSLGALGLIPDNISANELAEGVGWAMAVVAAVFSFIHHRDFKAALRAGLAARARAGVPEALADQETPIEGDAEHGE